MRKQQTPLRRLSGMANWVLPKHSGLFDLEFDRYQSLRAALGPAMTDPFVLVVSLVQIVAYAYFFRTLLLLPDDACNALLPSLLQFAAAAIVVQLLWAVKAVYLFEKAAPEGSSVIHAIARIIRTTVITLPFSFIPAWVIGCLAWPFLRINAVSGFRFYDQSLLIGQYVQNSMWYIGASQGGVRENLHRVRNWQAQPTETPRACAVFCSDKPNSSGSRTAWACLSSSIVRAFDKQTLACPRYSAPLAFLPIALPSRLTCDYYFMIDVEMELPLYDDD